MKHFLMLILGSASLAACEMGDTASVITVEGSAEVLVMPDAFELRYTVSHQGADRVALLEAAAREHARLKETLPQLDGLAWARFEDEELNVEPLYNQASCNRYNAEGLDCYIAGYQIEITGNFQAGPAEMAGNAASLSTELGAQSVGVSGFYVREPEQYRVQARLLAGQDAREQATNLSAALGMEVGDVHAIYTINPTHRFRDFREFDAGEEESITVTAYRTAASRFDIAVTPVVFNETLTVQFTLEAPSAGD